MGIGAKIVLSSIPLFIVAHGAAMGWILDDDRKRLWRAVSLTGYAACAACIVVGLMWAIWL